MPTLSGTLADFVTGSPVKGVLVFEAETGLQARTAADGTWSIVTTNSGTHTISYTLGSSGLDASLTVVTTDTSGFLHSSGSGLYSPLTGPGSPNPSNPLEGYFDSLLGPDNAQQVLSSLNMARANARSIQALIARLADVPSLGGDNVFRGTTLFAGYMLAGWGNGQVPGVLTTVTVAELGGAGVHQTLLTFTNAHVTITHNGGVTGYGGLNVYTLPTGNLLFLGAVVANLALTKSTSGINSTFRSTLSLGTATADSGATLTGTEANLIPSTSVPQAVAGATTATGRSTTTQGPVVLDGTYTTTSALGLGVYLNFLVNVADETDPPGDLILNGQIVLTWINLGDY